jgi:hypothetical protein
MALPNNHKIAGLHSGSPEVVPLYLIRNLLFGNKIWSGESAAVWHRSDVAKPNHFPYTYSCNGESSSPAIRPWVRFDIR